jgi:hypothetical protein
LIWNLLLFQNQRGETDIAGHLQHLFNSPLSTLAAWFIHYLQSVLNTAFFAWIVPFQQRFFSLSIRQLISSTGFPSE